MNHTTNELAQGLIILGCIYLFIKILSETIHWAFKAILIALACWLIYTHFIQ